MQSKRRWLPSWQRIELVEKCLEHGMTRRQAASVEEIATGSWAEDRPSTPDRQPRLTSVQDHDRVCAARRRTGWGPRLIATEVQMAHSTVSGCLERRGCSRPPREPKEKAQRFEWPCPGDLLQMDTKRFQRFTRPGHAVTGDRHRSGVEKRMRVGDEFVHSLIG